MGLLFITDGPLLQPHTVADNNNPGQQHVQNLYNTLTKLWGDSPSLVLATHIKQMHTCKVYTHLWDCLSLRHCPEPFCSPQSYTDNEEAVSVAERKGKDWLGRTRVCLHVTEYQSLVPISLLDQIKMKFQAFALKNKVTRMWESDTGFLDSKMCEKAFAQWVDYTGKNKHYLTDSHINTWQAHYSPITQCKPSFMEHWTCQQSNLIKSSDCLPSNQSR